jgi:hypothetical protein
MNEPGSQRCHGLHELSLKPAEKRPDAQGRQDLSLVAAPAAEMNSPAWQSRCGLQGVAGLRSSSHCPSAQATALAEPPAQ